jgi:hypothetical protein
MTIRLSALVIAALAAMAAEPAMADAGHLGGMGGALFGDSFFHFSKQNLKTFPVSTIRAGRLRVELQRTRLSEVQRAFGGTIYEQGSGMRAARWLCYEGPEASTWFMSNIEGGNEFVMMVATEAGGADGSCDRAPADLGVPDFGIPGLGASLDQLKAHFGSAVVGSHSAVSYRVDRPARDGLGTAYDAEYVGYIMRGGRVAAVGVGETTAQ